MFEKLARFLARWQAKLKHWHALWHVGTIFGTLAHKSDNLARFWHVCTQARWHVNHNGTQARWHLDHGGTHDTRFSKLLSNISRSKDNQSMKLGQLIEYIKKNIFLKKLCKK